VKHGLPLNYFANKVQQSLYQMLSAQKLRSVDLTARKNNSLELQNVLNPERIIFGIQKDPNQY
jgi:hypothetical protein